MSVLTLRTIKGSPLTNAELDANFTNLDQDKAPTANPVFTGNVVFTGGIKEKQIVIAASNIDLSLGTCFTKTVSSNTTFTVSNIVANSLNIFILELTFTAGSAITWWTGVKWASATIPSTTSVGKDIFAFYTYDNGTTWNGVSISKDVK